MPYLVFAPALLLQKVALKKEIMLTIEIKIWWSLSWTKKIVALFNCVEEIEEFGLVCKFGEWGPILKSGIVRTILNFAIKEQFGKQTFLKFLNPEYIKKFLNFENR